jgi:hypothetical protein
MWSKKKTCLRWCAIVVIIAMPSVLGFYDGSHYARKRTNVVKIAMLNVLGFNDVAIIVERKKCGLRRRWV